MPNEPKQTSWQIALAVAGLAVSLFGNWIQYQSLSAKKVELEQAQSRLDESTKENQRRRDGLARKRSEMEARMGEIDAQILYQEGELRAGVRGIVLTDQQDIAASMANTAKQNLEKLASEKKQLQDKIDALPTE